MFEHFRWTRSSSYLALPWTSHNCSCNRPMGHPLAYLIDDTGLDKLLAMMRSLRRGYILYGTGNTMAMHILSGSCCPLRVLQQSHLSMVIMLQLTCECNYWHASGCVAGSWRYDRILGSNLGALHALFEIYCLHLRHSLAFAGFHHIPWPNLVK